MAKWFIQRETPPGSGIYVIQDNVPAQPDPADGIVTNEYGRDVYQDGYPDDFSGWGQDQSDTIQNFLLDCSAADNGVSYAATWVGPDYVSPDTPQGLLSSIKPVAPKTVLLVQSSKVHKRPKRHGHHGQGH